MMSFFDKYPRFYSTSKTGAFPNRLNRRYIAEIYRNKEIIKYSTILDLGSHDGRWIFAAVMNGAKHVMGIEAREELVKNSYSNFEAYNISEEKYSFICGDVFEEIKKIKPNTFNIIFCFGFFYHIMNHMLLLSEIKRINPEYLIFGTLISTSDRCEIEIVQEDSNNESYGIRPKNTLSDQILSGIPSKSALELMLKNYGFEISYYDWHDAGIQNWEHLEDYRDNKRLSFRAKNSGFKKE